MKISQLHIVASTTALKQTVLGAKYLIYDPLKNYENIYSWKANHSFNWHQLIPAVSFAGANFTMADNPYSFFSKCRYFTKK
jgi:hypothetical protein